MAVIFHIDINAFFASAHVIENPELKGKPIAVCSNHRGSVITTASYEARKFGVTSAMPLMHALTLCPDLVVVDIDFDLYRDLSQQFISIIRSYSPLLEQASIDECYVDVSDVIKTYNKPLDLAVAIQERVMEELLLPISIGVAPNKFLAKMASDMQKPNGITVLRIREVSLNLWPLPIEEMHGIGRKTVPKLKQLNVNTIGDLAQMNPDILKPIMGINTQTYIDRANGKDNSEIVTESQTKSVGQSKTFSDPMTDLDEIRYAIRHETEQMITRLKNTDMIGKTVTLGIRMQESNTVARSLTMDTYTDDLRVVFERVMGLYDEFDSMDGVVFVSVSISNLVPKEDHLEQINLFAPNYEPSTKEIIQKLNDTLKRDAFITPKDLLSKKEGIES